MKTIITFLFSLSFIFCVGQQPVTEFHDYFSSISSKWINDKVVYFTYNENGDVIEALTYDLGNDKPSDLELIDTWNYLEDGRLESHYQESWDYSSKKWKPSLTHEKMFDESGCMISESFWQDYPLQEYFHQYEYFENCQKSTFIVGSTKLEYEKNDNSFLNPYQGYFFDQFEGWEKHGSGIELYDEKLRLIEVRRFTNGGGFSSINLYNFDEFDNLTSFKNYHYGSGTKELIKADSTKYFYNAQKNIEKVEKYEFNRLSQSYALFESELYEYYCDGLLKSKKREVFSGIYQQYRIYYEYDSFPECEEKVDIEFSISPNPARYTIEIKSDLLERENTFIKMYDFSGRLILNRLNVTRSHNYFIEVRNMNSGIYFVEIQNGKERATQKLLVR